jgi:hypothetical protein
MLSDALGGTAYSAMDNEVVLHSVAGGVIVAAALTFARLLLEYGFRGGERRIEHEDRRRSQQRDAEARLERVLQDRLAEADRRLERLQQAYDLLLLQYANLQAEHERMWKDSPRRLASERRTGSTG